MIWPPVRGWILGEPPLGSRMFHVDADGHVDAVKKIHEMGPSEAKFLRTLCEQGCVGYDVHFMVGQGGQHEPCRTQRSWPFDNTILDDQRRLTTDALSEEHAAVLRGWTRNGNSWRLILRAYGASAHIYVTAWNLRTDVVVADGDNRFGAYDFPKTVPEAVDWAMRQLNPDTRGRHA